jgi:hypothetical protein
MVNYHDPVTVAQDYGAYAFHRSQEIAARFTGWSLTEALVNFWHVVDGIIM